MEPKVDIFVLAPQMYFEEWEIDLAEERLAGFAHVIHGNQDVGVFRPNNIVSCKADPEKNAEAISDTIKRIVDDKPDEIFTVSRAWDCDEIRLITDFCKIAGIKVVEFDLDIVVPDGQRKMYKRQDELLDKKAAEEKDLLNEVTPRYANVKE